MQLRFELYKYKLKIENENEKQNICSTLNASSVYECSIIQQKHQIIINNNCVCGCDVMGKRKKGSKM